MATYTTMARDAERKRARLEKEIEKAREAISDCEGQIAILDQVLSALKDVKGQGGAASGRAASGGKWRPGRPGRPPKGARRGGPKAKKRKAGKWRPGRPGRPPKWYVEQQKAAGAGSGKKAGGRRGGKRKAAKRRGKSRRGRKGGAAAAEAASS